MENYLGKVRRQHLYMRLVDEMGGPSTYKWVKTGKSKGREKAVTENKGWGMKQVNQPVDQATANYLYMPLNNV